MAFGVDDPSASASMPTPSPTVTNGWFQGGNPALNLPATTITVDWLNAVSGEISNAVIALGGTPNKASINQLATGLTALTTSPTFSGSVSVGNNLTVAHQLTAETVTVGLGGLNVGSGGINAQNAAVFLNTLYASGAASIAGNLTVSGGIIVNGAFSRFTALPTTDPNFTGNLWNCGGQIVLSGYVAPSGKNLAHNSMFRVNQRGTVSVTSTGGYPADRWFHLDSGNGSRTLARTDLSDADRAAIGDESFTSCVQIQTTGASGPNDYEILRHSVEGNRRLSGKTITLSFWARAAAPAFIATECVQYFGTGGSSPSAPLVGINPFKYSISTSWTRFSTTFNMPSSAGKTFGTNGDDYTDFYFWTSAGSGSNGRTGNLGPQTSNIQMTGVQIEYGSVATPNERVNPRDELNACQRFYQFYPQVLISGYGSVGATIYTDLTYAVPMRAVPTANLSANQSQANAGAPILNGNFTSHIRIGAVITATGSAFSIFDLNLAADL